MGTDDVAMVWIALSADRAAFDRTRLTGEAP
jgi:hypothetical protein